MQAFRAASGGPIEVLPLVVVTQAFPARPSSLPRIRDFVRQRSGQYTFSEDDVRALGERLLDALLDVAGPNGMIQVSVRIFPAHAEIDVLPATLIEPVVVSGAANGGRTNEAAVNGNGTTANGNGTNGRPVPDTPVLVGSFAEWLAGALRRESMTMEAAARRLQVSVKTVSRWVGGTTEPRLRDLSRIREIFGEFPLQ
jgi:Helix-turn-helix